MLTVYPDSGLYAEIQRGNWQEESELEKYKENCPCTCYRGRFSGTHYR